MTARDPSRAEPPPPTIVTDFDGTIVTADIGDHLCAVAAPEAFAAFKRETREGRSSLLEGQRRVWPLVRLSRERFLEHVDAVARFRSGFERFLAAAKARGMRVVVASNGFVEYIERVLGRGGRSARIDAIYANRLAFDGDRVTPSFPFFERYGCPDCGICKGRLVAELRASGSRVTFVGDGDSDRCAAAHADAVFAVAGGSFERHLRSRGVAHRPFTSFDEVSEAMFGTASES